MLSSIALLTLLAGSALVHADVTPNTPGPGDSFQEGGTCSTTWFGDDVKGSDEWKNMDIELMSGDNFNMVFITTVATGQDGSTNGQFQFPCPNVTPNSAIYFYQYSSASAANKTWTTRFTIAGADGSTTPPANAVQPGSGDKIPWGVGGLTDTSKAVAAPAYLGASGTGSANVSASASASPSPAAVTSSPSGMTVAKTSSASKPTGSTSTNGTTGSSSTNDAVSANGSWKMGATVAASIFALALAL